MPRAALVPVDACAHELGISRAAVELYRASEVIDLHIDSFIWQRLFGYDLRRRHRPLFGAACFGQVDFPRILAAGIGGATWVITTNPLREPADRAATFSANLERLCAIFASVSDDFSVVTSAAEYGAARAQGKHAAFIGVQGGNAFDASLADLERACDGRVLRVTLVHLSSSRVGATSSPLKLFDSGLSDFGAHAIALFNARGVLVDLAHVSRRGFWAAVDVQAKGTPFLVSHTGVAGVHRHWRNLDDAQLRAVANSGGVAGIMYHAPFLGDRLWAGKAETIVRHLEHVLNVAGEDTPALGSDWDGAIVTPRDMPTCLELPRLVEHMLLRKFSPNIIQKILGQNFLRVVRDVRG